MTDPAVMLAAAEAALDEANARLLAAYDSDSPDRDAVVEAEDAVRSATLRVEAARRAQPSMAQLLRGGMDRKRADRAERAARFFGGPKEDA